MKVTIIDNVLKVTLNSIQGVPGSGGGSVEVDKDIFTEGSSNITTAGGVYKDDFSILDAGTEAAVRLTPYRAMHVNLRNNDGTVASLSTSSLAVETGGNLATIATNTSGIATASNQAATQATAGSSSSKATGIQGVSGGLPVPVSGIFWQSTQPVSLSSIPLATGAATNAGITGVSSKTITDIVNSLASVPVTNTSLSNLDVALSTRLKPSDTLAAVTNVGSVTSITNPLPAGTNVIGHVVVDSAPTTAITNSNLDVALSTRLKPSDTLTAVTTVGTIANALPSGSNLIGKTGIDQTTPGTTNKVSIGSDGVVSISGSAVVTGTFWQATQPISVLSLPLPSGASTSSKQPNLGVAGTPSVDVLTVQGVTSMTPIKVDGSAVTQPISGTITITPSGTQTVAGTVTANQGGTWTVQPGNTANTTPWKVDGSSVTQPVSVSSLPLPSGAATSALQTTMNTTLGSPMQNSGGSVTANAGTNLNTSTLAVESGGNLANLNTMQGNSSDSAATTDIGTFSLISLFKRSLQSLTSIAGLFTSGTQLTRITNGTQSADTFSADSGSNGLVIGGSSKVVTFSAINSTTSGIDVSAYKSYAILATSVSGVWIPQFSNDNVNFAGSGGINSSNGASTGSIQGTGTILYGAVVGKYFRLLAGTSLTATVQFSSSPAQSTIVAAGQLGSWSVSAGLNAGTNSIGTVQPGNTANTIPWLMAGQAAHAASISGNPFRLGARALTSNYTAVSTGQAADLVSTLVGSLIIKPYSIPEADWSYAAATGGISNTTTAVTIAAAAGSGLRNYITGIDLTATALGVGTEFAIRDGASGTVLWRTDLTTSGLLSGFPKVFPTPLKSSANTLLEIVTLTATVTGSIYFNCSGYIAP